jgi:hypothetical protein
VHLSIYVKLELKILKFKSNNYYYKFIKYTSYLLTPEILLVLFSPAWNIDYFLLESVKGSSGILYFVSNKTQQCFMFNMHKELRIFEGPPSAAGVELGRTAFIRPVRETGTCGHLRWMGALKAFEMADSSTYNEY